MLLGRTNEAFRDAWLRLELPTQAADIAPLANAAFDSGRPMDLSVRPVLWGGHLRQREGWDTRVVYAQGSFDYERASDHTHAIDLVQSNLIETLSALGRMQLDFYALPIRRVVEEFQIAGALEALEAARSEGHVRFSALSVQGPALAALATWQFHDAFEVLVFDHDDEDAETTLVPMAQSRRVGIVRRIDRASYETSAPDGYRLVRIRSAAEGESLP
ncbi:MAG: hypothetical protein SFX74_04755 [Fimbriimonadaceae bacterium]|nr:hypothetical protein [Fimbriimonadaceae bacterium]